MKKNTEKTAAKSYSCDACGCNILKGHRYLTERIWSSGSFDDDGEYYKGHMQTMHYHLSGSECDIATRLVTDTFFNPQH